MRGVSVVVLFFSFLQKTCVIAYILSTLIRAVSKDTPQQQTSRYARYATQRNDSDNDDSDTGDGSGDYNLS